MVNEILIDEAEAARRLSLSKRTLFQLRSDGVLPFCRCGTKILYSPDDLKRFAASRRQTATA